MTSTEEHSAEIPNRGNLTDFVSGVTDESILHVEVAVKEDGRCALFHNKPFRKDLSWLEFDLDERRLDFVLETGESRDAGIPLSKEVSKHMQNSHQILMILMDDKTGEAKKGSYMPLILHGK